MGEVVEGDGFRTIINPKRNSGSDAGVGGELTITEGECLAIVEFGDTYLVAWPHGTGILDDRIGVHVPGTGDIELGTTFSAAGLYASGSEGHTVPPLPTECEDEAVGQVSINLADSVTVE